MPKPVWYPEWSLSSSAMRLIISRQCSLLVHPSIGRLDELRPGLMAFRGRRTFVNVRFVETAVVVYLFVGYCLLSRGYTRA